MDSKDSAGFELKPEWKSFPLADYASDVKPFEDIFEGFLRESVTKVFSSEHFIKETDRRKASVFP